MAWGRRPKEEDTSSKDTVVAMYERMLEEAKERIASLEAEKKNLMDAFLAVKSPEAYRDMVMDRERVASVGPDPLDLHKRSLVAKTTEAWLQGLERPMFSSPEDIETYLVKQDQMRKLQDDLGPEAAEFETKSLHGNSES
jgi:hypothetical protein